MKNALKEILEKKKERVSNSKKIYTSSKISELINNNTNYIDFHAKLKTRDLQGDLSIIAEIKKASPSSGIIVKDFNHLDIAKQFVDNGASFLSVLTEEDHFLGKLEYIDDIKNKFKIPVLCKDFFIDTHQVSLAKGFGADCVLIILSAVDNALAKDLYQAANDLDMATLVEVHNSKEAESALSFEKSIIGINNRNLETLKVSLDTTIDLVKVLDSHKNPMVSESGINTVADIEFIIENTSVYNFLIGESLLKSNNIAQKLKELTQISL